MYPMCAVDDVAKEILQEFGAPWSNGVLMEIDLWRRDSSRFQLGLDAMKLLEDQGLVIRLPDDVSWLGITQMAWRKAPPPFNHRLDCP